MNYLMDFIEYIKEKIIISHGDSDEDRAKKIIWYAFFGSFVLIFVVSWIIFVLFTFTSTSIKIPNMVGDDVYSALKKMSDKDLMVRVFPKFNDKYPEGTVYLQNPSHGAVVKRGRLVILTVSLGNQDNSLPDFTGMTMFEVDDLLNAKYPLKNKAPYTIETPVTEHNDKVAIGQVIRQTPEAGTMLKKVKKVQLVMSSGPASKTAKKVLNNYTGKRVRDILGEISSLGIAVTFHLTPTKNKDDDGLISGQSLAAGMSIDEMTSSGKVLVIEGSRFNENKTDYVIYDLNYNMPYNNLPYSFSVKERAQDGTDRVVISFRTKGNGTFTMPVVIKKFSKIVVTVGDKTVVEEEVK